MTTRYFIRSLTALDYPEPHKFDPTDSHSYRFVVAWLENRYICLYDIEQRKKLNDIELTDWETYFNEYLDKLKITSRSNDPAACLYELLSLALLNHVTDDENKTLMDTTGSKYKESSQLEQLTSSLDTLDVNTDEFKTRVYELATFLEIPHYPDHMVVLSACCNLICDKFDKDEIEYVKKNEGKIKLNYMSLDDVTHGLGEKSDPLLKKMVSIVRLIHIHKLRNLQTDINVSIVKTQPIVADPKTDSSLGKVGY